MPMVRAEMRLTFIPCKAAASASWEIASMALPIFVLLITRRRAGGENQGDPHDEEPVL